MIQFSPKEAVILANSYPPLLHEDYMRLEENASIEFRWYLIGLTCSLAKDKAFQSNVLNDQLSHTQIAKNCGCAEETIRRFMYYTNAVSRLQDTFPELASNILAGRTRLGLKTTIRLAKLPLKDICVVIKRIEKEDTSVRRILIDQIRVSSCCPRNYSDGNRIHDSCKSVKDKPRFDPDAQVIGLTYTIPSWLNAINRINTSDTLYGISESARVNLVNELENLRKATDSLTISIMGV